MESVLGVDIGQKSEPTAICVAEIALRKEDEDSVHHFLVRYLERLDPGSSFPAIAQRLSEVIAAIKKRTKSSPDVYADATGMGAPVVDLIRKASGLHHVHEVYFTHGDQRNEESEERVRMGKGYLVSRLQTLLQTRRLHLPQTRIAETLVQELLAYEIRVDESANEKYGAFQVGPHDDLVTALGLAVQRDPKPSTYISTTVRTVRVMHPRVKTMERLGFPDLFGEHEEYFRPNSWRRKLRDRD